LPKIKPTLQTYTPGEDRLLVFDKAQKRGDFKIVRLFERVKVGPIEVKNRIVMPAMGLGYTDDYTFTDRFKAYFRERAEGGVGLMLIGPIAIDKVGAAPYVPELFDDRNVEELSRFIEKIKKDTGVKAGTQLFHMGRNAFSYFTGNTPIAPSAIPGKLTGETPREMTKDDIVEVKRAFIDAARRAKEAGFDYVEPVGCTGYLISQFLSPLTNKRTDEYGGPIENRMRFGIEVVKGIKEAIGDTVAVGIRIAGNDFLEGGHTNKESAHFAAECEKAGADAINVTGGWHETYIPQLTTNVPQGMYLYLARGIKEKVDIPVFASNRLGNPEVAERAIRSKACDLVCWGRPLICDPELPNKVKEGRYDEIVPCIACNQGCFNAVFEGRSVSCILNPRAGRELELPKKEGKAKKKLKIMIAGGGPAGMEFAVTAGSLGHDVTLYEKESRLGGQINLAMSPPGKAEFMNIIESFENRMKKFGVELRLGEELTPEMVKKLKPEVLVVATGAEPIEIKVPGIDKPHVISAWDVLMERVTEIGENVVIIGGSATGCETAHYIAAMNVPDADTFRFILYHDAEEMEFAKELLYKTGRTITVIDMVERLADNVGKTSRWSLMKSLRLLGVNLKPKTKLVEITDDAVIVESDKGQYSIPADTVITAVGAKSVGTLLDSVSGNDDINVITIGDAAGPRKITEAVQEGFEEAYNL